MEPRFISLSDYVPEESEWVWQDRIPGSAIVLLEGDPGLGKSALLSDVVARVTSGRPMFGCTAGKAAAPVIILQGEDSLDTTQRNLQAAGADLSKTMVYDPSAAAGLDLPRDLEFLSSKVEATNARLIILDPLVSFTSLNLTNDRAARQLTQPLTSMAHRLGVTIIAVRHLVKTANRNAAYRGYGGVALIAASRAVLLLAVDPGNPDGRIMAQTKSSLASPAASLSFRIVSRGNAVGIDWQGPASYSASQLLDAGNGHSETALEEAIFVLYSILGDGPLAYSEVRRLATTAGIAPRTLRRARERLAIKSHRMGFGPGSTVFWEMPRDHELVVRLLNRDIAEVWDKACDDCDDATASHRGNVRQPKLNGQDSQRPEDDADSAGATS